MRTTRSRLRLYWPLILLLAFFLCSLVAAKSLTAQGSPLLNIEHVGVPFPSWSSPVNGLEASPLIINPHLNRQSHLAPRFHRMLRYGMGLQSKTQTAIFVAGRSSHDEETGKAGASIISALNPRDGGIVWRSIRNDSDNVHSMHLSSDVMLTISGLDQLRVSLLHALTGTFLWSVPLPSADDALPTGLVDATLIPPINPANPEKATVTALAPDAIVMDRAGAIRRLAGVNGAIVWSKEPISMRKGNAEANVIPLKLHSDKKHVIVASLVRQEKSGLFSAGEKYGLQLDVFFATNGDKLATMQVPNADVQMQKTSSTLDTSGNVILIGRDAEGTSDRPPHLVWLQNDGSIKSFAIPLPNEIGETHIDPSTIRSLRPKTASKYDALFEIQQLRSRGVLMARTNNARAEALRIDRKNKQLANFWEMEEEAWDAIFSGGVDKQGNPYVNRVFFSRSQHLANFHTLWVDKYDEQGQVTGASFQWDHDLNGDILAAPFEVSPVNDYQLVWRSAFVTQSSSVRMLQDERHQWIREEGLSHTVASLLVDLPESSAAAGKVSDVRAIAAGESILSRIERHSVALQGLPGFIFTLLLEAIKEIPNISLDSIGILPPKQAKPKSSASAPIPTSTAARGAAPMRGVGAQKLGNQGVKQRVKNMPPPGIPPVQPRGARAQEQGPPPPAHLAPREANSTVTKTLVRDRFGLRTLIVAASKKGKVYAIDSQTGNFIWEKSLFGFGQGEGAASPTVDVKLLALTRPVAGSGVDLTVGPQAGNTTAHSATSQLKYGGLLTVVATVIDEGATLTRMWELDPVSGRFAKGSDGSGLALFPGEAKEAFLLPVEDAQSGQIASAAVSKEDTFVFWPTTQSTQSRFLEVASRLYYATVEKDGAKQYLSGYVPKPKGSIEGALAWQITVPEGDTIVSLTRASQDQIASQGKVLGDRTTLYKYLNPHLLVLLTKNLQRRRATIFVLDGVSGKIIHEEFLCEGNLAFASAAGLVADPIAVLTENWITVAFDVDIPAADTQAQYKGAHRQTRLLSLELYDRQSSDRNQWQWRNVFSSFTALSASTQALSSSSLINAYSQIFVLPYGVRGMSATRTKLGISSKAIVVGTHDNQLQVLPRRLLDPRRPVARKPTTHEMEEGLMTYDAFLTPTDPKRFQLFGGNTARINVPLPQRLHTKPTQLESTSLVFIDQSLDFVLTTVAPSGSFDLLSKSFNKFQLALTIVVLTVALVIVRPMVASKTLLLRW